MASTYEAYAPEHGVPIKAWTRGVPVEDAAKQQLLNIATLPSQSDPVDVVHTLKQVVVVKG